MRFEWDENKNRINKSKHGIDFEYARHVWDDPNYLILVDVNSFEEERWLAIGNVGHVSVVVAVHTYRGDEDDPIVRIISARKATRHERTRYEEEILR